MKFEGTEKNKSTNRRTWFVHMEQMRWLHLFKPLKRTESMRLEKIAALRRILAIDSNNFAKSLWQETYLLWSNVCVWNEHLQYRFWNAFDVETEINHACIVTCIASVITNITSWGWTETSELKDGISFLESSYKLFQVCYELKDNMKADCVYVRRTIFFIYSSSMAVMRS